MLANPDLLKQSYEEILILFPFKFGDLLEVIIQQESSKKTHK